MTGFRAPDFTRVTRIMLLRLEGHALTMREKSDLAHMACEAPDDAGVTWGGSRNLVRDILGLVNHKRNRDGRTPMDDKELISALRHFLNGRHNEPLAEEISDALCNLREARMSVFKIPPEDDLKRIA